MYIFGKFIAATLFILLAALFPSPGRGQEATGRQAFTWPTEIPWSNLILSGAKLGTTLTVQVALGPAAEVARLQPWPGLIQGSSCSLSPSQASMLSTSLTVKGMLRNSRYSEGLWFDRSGSPQRRLRYNQERGDYWLKEYCWEKTGVRRSKLVLAGDASMQGAAAWREQSLSWYPLPESPSQCSHISDPALLIVLASAMAREPQRSSLSLCSFGRQQLFMLEMVRETGDTRTVSYRILQDGRSAQERSARIQPLVYRVSTKNMPTGNQIEVFSLMGLEDNIRIFVDPTTYLPIRLSGNAKLAGKVELELREAQLN